MTREIRPELLDELLSGDEKPADLLGKDGIFQQLRKRLLERALDAELSEHLGYEKHQRSGRRGANSRNGHAAFEAGPWAKRYPMIAPAWRRAWVYVVPFFAFPPAIRKMIYTTNAVESLNRTLRKVIKTRGSFPSDEAALKLLYLAIQHAGLRWKPAVAWPEAKLQFLILFEDRIAGSAS